MKEFEAQKTVFQWAKLITGKYPCLKYMTASMVGTNTSVQSAVKARSMGVKKGFPDIFLPSPTTYHGLFIELKIKPNKPSPEQEDYICYLNNNGYYATICYGAIEAIKVIEQYLRGQL